MNVEHDVDLFGPARLSMSADTGQWFEYAHVRAELDWYGTASDYRNTVHQADTQ